MTRASRRFSRIPIFCLAGVGLILGGGCSQTSKPYTPDLTPVKPPEQLYSEAEFLLTKKRYEQAAKGFEEVDKQHAFTATARRALLKAAEAYYVNRDYDKAADAAQRYIMLNPNEGDVTYAYYLFGISNYGEVRDHQRDLVPAQRAVKALSYIVEQQPKSPYAQDAAAKAAFLRELLAAHEMDVGRYYLKSHNYTGAINRFRTVLAVYPMTKHMPEALMRLTETYLRLGVIPEAQTAAAILIRKYPDSSWTKTAVAALHKHGLVPAYESGSSVGKLLQESSQNPTKTR
jgi:outer membrane protein assembly factor BamD